MTMTHIIILTRNSSIAEPRIAVRMVDRKTGGKE